MEEESFPFEGDALMDEAGGCPPRMLANDVVEVARTNIQQLGIVGHLVQGAVPVINKFFKAAEQGPVGGGVAGVVLQLIQAGEEEKEDMKIALQHALLPALVLFVFGQHLVHEVGEELLVGR